MKSLILALALSFSFGAQALVISEQASLKNWSIDANSSLLDLDLVGAQVSLNHQKEEIKLSLMTAWTCPRGLVCATVMPETTISFKLLSLNRDRCGVRTIAGQNNENQTIVITDYTTSHCTLDNNSDMIVVDLLKIEGNVTVAQDQFFGEKFIQFVDQGIVEGSRLLEINHQQVVRERNRISNI